MEIVVKKLSSDMADDFLDYFDNTAFTDHPDWSACYCLESHLDKETEEKLSEKPDRREKAKELILNGVMHGYLAYDKEKVVGWCNADDKINYTPILENKEYLTDQNKKGR